MTYTTTKPEVENEYYELPEKGLTQVQVDTLIQWMRSYMPGELQGVVSMVKDKIKELQSY